MGQIEIDKLAWHTWHTDTFEKMGALRRPSSISVSKACHRRVTDVSKVCHIRICMNFKR